MRRAILVLGLITFAGTGCAPPFANQDGADIVKMIQEAQKAGWVRHDANGYFAIWTGDARRIEGRMETPDKHDNTVFRDKYEAVTLLRFAVPAPNGVFLTFDDVKAEVHGDTATIQFRMTMKPAETYFGPRRTLTTGELFRLRRLGRNWWVEENRSWPIESWAEDYVEKFDQRHWDALDDRVEKVQTIGEKVGALQQGRRFAEACALAKEWSQVKGRYELKPKSGTWTEDDGKHPESWVARGLLDICVGDADDAKASFRHALGLDPKANMPEYARTAAK